MPSVYTGGKFFWQNAIRSRQPGGIRRPGAARNRAKVHGFFLKRTAMSAIMFSSTKYQNSVIGQKQICPIYKKSGRPCGRRLSHRGVSTLYLPGAGRFGKSAVCPGPVMEVVHLAERSVELDSIELAAAIFGNCDQNVRLLENEFGVTAVCRGSALKFTGEEEGVAAAVHAVQGMVTLMENRTPLDEQTVRYCINLAREGEEKRLRELTDDFVAVTAKGRPIHPKTLGQKEYIAAIRANAITFGVGPAGTGKTYLAVAMAVKAFKAKEVDRIILTRPAVEAGEKLGFLPGDLQNKVDPYLRPLYDGLFDLLGAENFQRLVEKQTIEVAPLAYMRGRTLDDAFIILDEAQNTTPEQMKMFLTRMGANSKVVVTGDVTQIDLPDKARSGLVDALKVLRGIQGIAQIQLSDKDVVRHRLVQQIVKAYERAAGAASRR